MIAIFSSALTEIDESRWCLRFVKFPEFSQLDRGFIQLNYIGFDDNEKKINNFVVCGFFNINRIFFVYKI